MRTPSLRSRIAVLGAVVVAVVLLGVNCITYLTFRAQLMNDLGSVLDERAAIAEREARAGASGADLAERLTQLGLVATVWTRDGARYEASPASPVIGKGLPAPKGISRPALSRDVALPDGAKVTVFASRAGVDDATNRFFVLEAIGLVVATALAALLLFRNSKRALQPLDSIVASARRTSAGARGQRLRPDRPDTVLGALATAYDEMLDTLESSERRASEAQLDAESLYLNLRQVIETANAAFVAMDRSGVVTDWNSKAEEIFGWRRSEVVGRSLADTLVPPELRERHNAGLARFLETGEHRVLGTNMEFEALRRNGERVPVEISTWVSLVGNDITFSAFLRDISERRKGEEAISRLASIVETAQEAICSSSLDDTIITWNVGAERLYGYTAAEAVGQRLSLIVPALRHSELDEIRRKIAAGQSVARRETSRVRKDGTEVEVAITCAPIHDGRGVVVGASTIARDITDQRRIASELEQTMAALERALDDARGAEERSRRFLADAAHQLRTPIAGVRACAETLLRGTPEGDGDRLLADLVREASRIGKLITALLQLAHIDQGAPHDPAWSDVMVLCESEVERVRALEPNLTVTIDASELVGSAGDVDASVVSEILSNLLDNARRHARSTVWVRVRRPGKDVELEVADDGSGIADDALSQIFDRFVSLDGKGGSGLGLAIARSLARAEGGDIAYRPNPGPGASFVVTLPARIRLREEAGARRT